MTLHEVIAQKDRALSILLIFPSSIQLILFCFLCPSTLNYARIRKSWCNHNNKMRLKIKKNKNEGVSESGTWYVLCKWFHFFLRSSCLLGSSKLLGKDGDKDSASIICLIVDTTSFQFNRNESPGFFLFLHSNTAFTSTYIASEFHLAALWIELVRWCLYWKLHLSRAGKWRTVSEGGYEDGTYVLMLWNQSLLWVFLY
mgnify:CR=1 FL=1